MHLGEGKIEGASHCDPLGIVSEWKRKDSFLLQNCGETLGSRPIVAILVCRHTCFPGWSGPLLSV